MDYIRKWCDERERRAFLALDDGTVFRGVAFGARRDSLGEAVFNTGMCGYQEIATDPSYAGQFVALTTAEVGNYGTDEAESESRGLFLSGLLVGDLTESTRPEPQRVPLSAYLEKHGIGGMRCVDTRALAIHLRDHGTRRAYLHLEDTPMTESEGVARARAWPGLDGVDTVSRVTRTEIEYRPRPGAPRVVCYDFGVKENILRSLGAFADLAIVPAATPAEDVLAMRPAGVFLSNGPGDPAGVEYAARNVRALLGKVPVMGICLGHQLLSIACGARTGRLAFGHHGVNHPVKDLATGKVEITSQNHNFAVLPESLPDCLEVTHVNLNDGTIEGVRHKTLPAFSIQYHPEACPGPHDSAYLFARFARNLTI